MNLNSLIAPAKVWYQTITDTWTGKAPTGAKRSSQWPKVREEFLKANPVCECCGGKDALEVHHVEPFHINPERELDPDNLMTLCESKRFGVNCHLFVGHLGNYSRWNPLARLDAMFWAAKLSGWFAEQIRRAAGRQPSVSLPVETPRADAQRLAKQGVFRPTSPPPQNPQPGSEFPPARE